MVTALVTPTVFRPVLPSLSSSKNNPTMCWKGRSKSLNTNGNNFNFAPHRALLVKMQTKEPPEENDTEKRQKELNLNPRQLDLITDTFGGKLLHGGLVLQQKFLLRSYESNPDGKVSIEALVNRLQESTINHLKSLGLQASGFGSTPVMHRKDLVWVVYRLQIEVERLPTWADVVQVDHWFASASGKRKECDWLVRDYKTGETLIRATSLYMMMNTKTRKISLEKEVGAEMKHLVFKSDPIINKAKKKLPHLDFETADYIRTGLRPLWNDLDINYHVNHVKYISWILESAPRSILASHNLSVMTLEYRKECGWNSILQSLTKLKKDGTSHTTEDGGVEFDHLLRAEDGSEILRGRTKWLPKNSKKCSESINMVYG
ncbi:palmitoyl-acyl carrier protein thioesterase, chloroplastic-like [Quercus robur]|uniref:palmitoyl-acyl carrier protein thioesterase, chloroplastic-like n=1 Tax=Quercus robur TaxID=38942 RepID=UPI002162F083|nr:palmitoyl-acyl carrier protein thioesterase, chloroplastic-like [Quercus robur]